VDPYENLANAIIMQAVKDYRNTTSPSEIKSIERFFRSDLFSALTSVDPEFLIKRLREERKHDF
jgi:hypothetical protein